MPEVFISTGAPTNLTGKLLSDTFMGTTFQSLSPTTRTIVLSASTKFFIEDLLEIGASYSLEIPATSSLEVRPTTPLASTLGLVSHMGNFVESGCIISGIASTAVTVSSGIVWINGQRIQIATYLPASQGSNVDAYYDADLATGTVILTTVGNNGASPALLPNRIRLGIAVSSGGSVTVINQGSNAAAGPTISSQLLTVQDSLGNLIYPASPNQILIGYRLATADITTTTSTSPAQFTCPVIVPLGRRIRISVTAPNNKDSGASGGTAIVIFEGAIAYKAPLLFPLGANTQHEHNFATLITPSPGLHTYGLQFVEIGGVGTATFGATALANQRGPIEMFVELM